MADSILANMNEDPMTVCIAAVCENKKALVLVADRLETIQLLDMTIEGNCKIHSFDKNMVMAAGRARRGIGIVNRLKKNPPRFLDDLADLSASEYRQARDKELDDKLLVPIGYNRQSFQDFGKSQLQNSVLDSIIFTFTTFDFDLDITVAGFVDGEARICRISNPGILSWKEDTSYDVIGSERLVASYLEMNKYNERMSLSEALLTVYGAKKQAESSKGVGKLTDIVILTNSGQLAINEESLKGVLEKEYERTHTRPEPNLGLIDALVRRPDQGQLVHAPETKDNPTGDQGQ